MLAHLDPAEQRGRMRGHKVPRDKGVTRWIGLAESGERGRCGGLGTEACDTCFS